MSVVGEDHVRPVGESVIKTNEDGDYEFKREPTEEELKNLKAIAELFGGDK